METNEQNQLTTTTQKAPVVMTDRGVILRDIEQLWRFGTMVARSGLAPKGLETPEAICVAIQMGMEVGLTPLAALQNIAVINGRPTIWGDAQLGIVRATGDLADFAEWYEVAGKRVDRAPNTYSDDVTAVCRVQRRCYKEPAFGSFSVADAKRAGLWNKQGPWSQYPGRMLKFRARSYVLRDQFGDALRGMLTAEEARDLPAIDVETVTVGETPPAAPSPTPTPATTMVEPDTSHRSGAAPESSSGAAPTPHEELAAYVRDECGVGIDRFNSVMVQTGNMDAEAATWEDVPTSLCTRLLRAKKGLRKMLVVAEEQGGAE